MKNIFTVLLLILSASFPGHATMRSLTPMEQAQTCYPSSPMIYSDACNGQVANVFPSAQSYIPSINHNLPFDDIAQLMYGLRGQQFPATPTDVFAGQFGSQPMLWENSSYLGNGFWGGAILSPGQDIGPLPRVQ